MEIKILRGTHEIGGNCIMIKSKKATILLDVGAPLKENSKPLEQINEKIDGIIISHAHGDHYGEMENVSCDKVYIGETTLKLIQATRLFLNKGELKMNFETFKNNHTFKIEDISITPYLVDHSAYDAYSFLIECEGKKVFYSGDFRSHGKKGKLNQYIINNLKNKSIDVLLCEGTTIGRSVTNPLSEDEIEMEIDKRIKESKKIVFVNMSGQNIDRIVDVFRAAKRNNRILIIDFYIAYILSLIDNERIPKASWTNNVRVFYPKKLAKQIGDDKETSYLLTGFGRFQKISAQEINECNEKYVMIIRNSMAYDLEKRLKNLDKATLIYSRWSGYSEQDKTLLDLAHSLNMNIYHIHTSGHAYRQDITTFLNEVKPKLVIPIHSDKVGEFKNLTDVDVSVMEDGETIEI